MRNILLTLSFLAAASVAGLCQPPQDKLNQWAAKNPIEKLYLHFDREDYLAGQTMWFRAYFYSEFVTGDKSTSLYVELLDAASNTLSRKAFPVFSGYAKGQISLPDSLPGGLYSVRAYSQTMLNHNDSFVYKRGFFVSGKNNLKIAARNSSPITRLDFFPEGGNFITGLLNTIAFKATDGNGFPIPVNGVIKNKNGELITEFNSWHDGMGSVEIMADSNSSYYAELSNDPAGKKYPLPQITDKGILFHMQAGKEKLFFEIQQPNTDPAFEAAYMIGQMQHRVVFRQPLQKNNGPGITGAINSGNLLSGILQVTVFNKDDMPLAERLCFINNREYIQTAELLTDSISFSARGKNHYTLSFKDTVTGSFSVAITDPAFDAATNRKENIFSRLLLTADLPGYVHNPAWYFIQENDSAKKAVDLVMMTNGWRRFQWTSFLKQPIPATRYKDPGYITLAGKVNIFGRQKPVGNKDFILFISSADSARSMEMLQTNELGEFIADSLVFFENTVILFSEMQNKKNKIDVSLQGTDSLMRSFPLSAIKSKDLLPVPATTPLYDGLNDKLLAEYEAMMKAEGLALSMVTVTAKKRTAIEELEKKYTSNLFSVTAEKTLDFTNNNDLSSYRNVFDYLQSRVPGLQVYRNGLDYVLYYRQRRTLMGGMIPMVLFLDEIRTEANVISFIPGFQVAMVKIFSTFVGTDGNASGGAIAVYTKKGDDLFNSLPSDGGQVAYKGYSIIKEFYAPDYSGPDKNNATVDHRMTLHWNPDIFLNGENKKVPVTFFNNDRSNSFKVVIEGMTTDGKMLLIEKTISKKAF